MNRNNLFENWKIACINEDTEHIDSLISCGFDINTYHNGFNALLYSVSWNKVKLFNNLIMQPKLNINIQGTYNQTALIKLSGATNNSGMLEKMLKHEKLDVNMMDAFRSTALTTAFQYSHHNAKLLLKHPNIDVKYITDYLLPTSELAKLLKSNIFSNYALQKSIIANGRCDIILFFKEHGVVNNRIMREYQHIFSGVELNLL